MPEQRRDTRLATNGWFSQQLCACVASSGDQDTENIGAERPGEECEERAVRQQEGVHAG